jgi:glycerol uptake facilitator-like aquaporin
MPDSDIGATTEMLFCEIFSSFLICLMFMTLKFRSIKREGTITKERDSVLIALALCGTVYAVTAMIEEVSGTFVNPAISFEEMLTSMIFSSDVTLASRYCFARLAGPFIGAIISGIFFLFQRELLNEADKLFVGGEIMRQKKENFQD